MKKITNILILTLMVLALTACSSQTATKEAGSDSQKQVSIIDDIDFESLTPKEAMDKLYEKCLQPDQIIKIESAEDYLKDFDDYTTIYTKANEIYTENIYDLEILMSKSYESITSQDDIWISQKNTVSQSLENDELTNFNKEYDKIYTRMEKSKEELMQELDDASETTEQMAEQAKKSLSK